MFQKFNYRVGVHTNHLFFGLALAVTLLFSSTVVAQRVTSINDKGTKLTTGNIVSENTIAPTSPAPIQGDIWLDTTDPNNIITSVWDGTTWQPVASTATEPWFGTDDDDEATTNTEDIYQTGDVGVGTTTINADANLELGATNKGFLINRVALTATNLPAPLAAHEEGMLVYNTATTTTGANDVSPGLYENNGAQWVYIGDRSIEPWFGTDDDAAATTNTEEIYTMGNVGIGIDTPNVNAKVSIAGGGIAIDGDGDGDWAGIGELNGGLALSAVASASANPHMFVSGGAGNNVGIGTTNPTKKLQVTGGSIFVSSDDNGINFNGGGRVFKKLGSGMEIRSHDTNHGIRFTTPDGTTTMIAKNGKVGIGTAAPNARLSVVANYGLSLKGTGTNDIGWRIGSTNGNNNNLYFWSDNAGSGAFRRLTLVNNGDILMGTNGGNVGIGTATPTEALDVVGNIKASGTITPDYVFEKYYEGESVLKADYEMMSLAEIERFTRANKHLPGVPSAKEVSEKGGIVLNRATEINLEKIEELYLHLIEQQKQIEVLKARLEALETN